MTPGRLLDPAPGRDAAVLADALRTLQAHLEGPTPEDAVVAAHVEELVAQAVAEIQRVRSPLEPPVGVSAPVLGAGVVTRLLQQQRTGAVVAPDPHPTVDTRR